MDALNFFINNKIKEGSLKRADPRPINKRLMWAYFSPDGYIQVRSIADTKGISREMISSREDVTWKDYEEYGYVQKRVEVNINLFK